MISMDDIEKLSDFECINLIYELVQRLKATAYTHGYKDGYNDAKCPNIKDYLQIGGEE